MAAAAVGRGLRPTSAPVGGVGSSGDAEGAAPRARGVGRAARPSGRPTRRRDVGVRGGSRAAPARAGAARGRRRRGHRGAVEGAPRPSLVPASLSLGDGRHVRRRGGAGRAAPPRGRHHGRPRRPGRADAGGGAPGRRAAGRAPRVLRLAPRPRRARQARAHDLVVVEGAGGMLEAAHVRVRAAARGGAPGDDGAGSPDAVRGLPCDPPLRWPVRAGGRADRPHRAAAGRRGRWSRRPRPNLPVGRRSTTATLWLGRRSSPCAPWS